MPIFRVQFRRDTTENWEKHNPILLYGEVGYEVTTTPGLILTKQGDGYLAADGKIYGTPWKDLPYCSGPPGPSPDYQWNGTILMFKKPDGEWGPGQDLVGPVPAHRWVGTALQFQTQTGSWGDLVDLQGTPGNANLLPATTTRLGGVIIGKGFTVNEQGCINVDAFDAIATLQQRDIVKPDGVTTTVDSTGLLSALGGTLQLNSEVWITESGTFTAPVTGLYDVFVIGGGSGGVCRNANTTQGVPIAAGGRSGTEDWGYAYLIAGVEYPVIIGTGGLGLVEVPLVGAADGSDSSFAPGVFVSSRPPALIDGVEDQYVYAWKSSPMDSFKNGDVSRCAGAGLGGGQWGDYPTEEALIRNSGLFYGAGGGACVATYSAAGNGAQGAVRLRYHDPAKANAATEATTTTRRNARKATRVVKSATVTTVNLYDPKTGQGSVWREEDVPAQLAKGLITQEAWKAICEQKAAEAHAAWLADPNTEAERIEMLRAACEQKLAQTDKFTLPDYPITDEQRQAILTYRQAIRALNHQEGSPWDGGGELTPWPEEPNFLSSLLNGQKSTNS